ncbi:MAG: HAD-IB family hydrolase [Spirochaetes bacterium]|nr:MAG: HAD-IB family hydrolase [Spirochaetota bacterium]
MSNGLALFDFDGTITVKDSTTDFIKYSCGCCKSIAGYILLSPVMLAFMLRLLSSHDTKQIYFAFFFKNWDYEKFQKIADEYCERIIPTLVRQNALERIRWHKERNDRVVVVSGACVNWLQKWCEEHEVDVLATELEVSEGRLTGRLSTRNCYGREKAKRIRAQYDLNQYDSIHSYGDSRGDMAMLELADERYYKYF